MKFTGLKNGHVGLLLAASVLLTSCNKDEYFPTEEMIAGVDAYCSKAPDQYACEALSACQPAFSPAEDESAEPVFEACVANPEIFAPAPATDPADDDNDDSTDDPVVSADPSAPTIEDALNSQCKNLGEEYLWLKQLVKKGKVVGGQAKVKVCHKTGNGSTHTILIACPALKAHVNHHDDYLGTCQQ